MATYVVEVAQVYTVTKVVHNCKSGAEAIRKLKAGNVEDVEGITANLGKIYWSTARALKE